MNKWVLRLIFLAIFAGGGYWLYQRYTQPVVGEAVADLGREHVTDISEVVYNSNPPTSGAHFVVWAKDGVYDRVISDGHLIHSLEHGYVIVSYDCSQLNNSKTQKLQNSIFKAYAHEEGDEIPADQPHEASDGAVLGGGEVATSSGGLTRPNVTAGMSAFPPENPPDVQVELPGVFGTESCKQLQGQLKDFYESNKNKRLIVVPRLGMETVVALTAWNRILKLSSWDESQTGLFMDQWENKGPEKTVE